MVKMVPQLLGEVSLENKKYYILRVRVSCEEQSVKDSGQFLILVFRGDDDEASEVSLGVR
jgi:hypothetical protein